MVCGALLKKSGNLFFYEKSRFFAFPRNLSQLPGLSPSLIKNDQFQGINSEKTSPGH